MPSPLPVKLSPVGAHLFSDKGPFHGVNPKDVTVFSQFLTVVCGHVPPGGEYHQRVMTSNAVRENENEAPADVWMVAAVHLMSAAARRSTLCYDDAVALMCRRAMELQGAKANHGEAKAVFPSPANADGVVPFAPEG
jgi:hypothetical protein